MKERGLSREDIEVAGWDGVVTKDHRALPSEEIRLMVGATPDTEKSEIRQGLANGSIKLVIGTHALIEDPVTFADLEMVIIDEQHRFGVHQRLSLTEKTAPELGRPHQRLPRPLRHGTPHRGEPPPGREPDGPLSPTSGTP